MSLEIVGREPIPVIPPYIVHGVCNKCRAVVEGYDKEWKKEFGVSPLGGYILFEAKCPECGNVVSGSEGKAPERLRNK